MFTPVAQRKGAKRGGGKSNKKGKARSTQRRGSMPSSRAMAKQAAIMQRLVQLEASHHRLMGASQKFNPMVKRSVMSLVNFLNPAGRKPIPRLVPTKVGLFETMVMKQLPYGQMSDTTDPRRGLAAITTYKCATRPGAYLAFNQPAASVDITMKLRKGSPEITGLWPT